MSPPKSSDYGGLVSESVLAVLRAIGKGNPSTDELAEALGVGRTTVEYSLKPLVAAGLVKREIAPGKKGGVWRHRLAVKRITINLNGVGRK